MFRGYCGNAWLKRLVARIRHERGRAGAREDGPRQGRGDVCGVGVGDAGRILDRPYLPCPLLLLLLLDSTMDSTPFLKRGHRSIIVGAATAQDLAWTNTKLQQELRELKSGGDPTAAGQSVHERSDREAREAAEGTGQGNPEREIVFGATDAKLMPDLDDLERTLRAGKVKMVVVTTLPVR